MISIDEAINIIDEETKVLGPEKVDLLSSLNRVLFEDIFSKDNLPPFNKSAMDGFAIHSEDCVEATCEAPVKLKVVALVKAGDYFEGVLSRGEAIKIMTGACVPKGATAVIQVEKVNEGDGFVTIAENVKSGTNIIAMGEEVRIGDLAISKSKEIRPSEIGLLASLGYSEVSVYKKPRVAIITTGDELLPVEVALEKGKIRNSNEYSLIALCKNLDVDVVSMGVVSDDKSMLRDKILAAFHEADIVISSGGVSAGDYDFVEEVLQEIGAEVKFTSVAIKPGKPTTFATFENKIYFGLPGNPLAVMTTFEEFVRPTILKTMGHVRCFEQEVVLVAGSDFKAKKPRTKYVYVEIVKGKDGYYAYEIGSQCSNHLITMSRANGIIIIPDGVNLIKVGDKLSGKFIFR